MNRSQLYQEAKRLAALANRAPPIWRSSESKTENLIARIDELGAYVSHRERILGAVNRAAARRNLEIKLAWETPNADINTLIRQIQSSRIERALTSNDYARLIVRALRGRFLDEKTAERVVNKMIQEKQIIRMDTIQTLVNENTAPYVLNLLTRGLEGYLQYTSTQGSDPLSEITIQNIPLITVSPAAEAKRPNKSGAYFPRFNKSFIDLSRYQIYRQEEAPKKQEQCLLHCLRLAKLSESRIMSVTNNLISGAHITRDTLSAVAELIHAKIIVSFVDNSGRVRRETHKSSVEHRNPINIALYDGHYFLNETVPHTRFAVRNMKNIIPYNGSYTRIKRGKYISEKPSYISSLTLVYEMDKQEAFYYGDSSAMPKYKPDGRFYLENISEEQRPYEVKERKKNDDGIWYADIESYVYEPQHRLMMLGVCSDDAKKDAFKIFHVEKYKTTSITINARKTVTDFMDYITYEGTFGAIVYFHNLKYDINILEPYLNIMSNVQKGNQIYSVRVYYKKQMVLFKDSLKILNMPLSALNASFNLGMDKMEAIAYHYYRPENYHRYVKPKRYAKFLPKKKRKQFYANLEEEGLIKENRKFSPLKYYKIYLKYDCLVLKRAMQTFRKTCREIMDVDIHSFLTISSFADYVAARSGCYANVYEMSGNLRAYVESAIYGGRVMYDQKSKGKLMKGNFQDYDGNSLYPSAMRRLDREKGLPAGPAMRLTKDLFESWEKFNMCILTVRITKVNKKQRLPFIAHKGIFKLDYSNEVPAEPVIISSNTLRDYITFHQIEYEILDGVYWNDSVKDSKENKTIGQLADELYERRLKIKKTNVPLANVIKLILNSLYGKTITKKTYTRLRIFKSIKYVKTEVKEPLAPKILPPPAPARRDFALAREVLRCKDSDSDTEEEEEQDEVEVDMSQFGPKYTWKKVERLSQHIASNFDTILAVREMGNDNVEIKEQCVDDSYNRAHIGIAILDYSKRIMSEIMDLANDLGIVIYYSDTDSLILDNMALPKLEKEYFERYGKVLSGPALEQFETDISIKGATNKYASKLIVLGKKSYALACHGMKEGVQVSHTHARLKGITKEGMEHAAKKMGTDIFGLYETMLEKPVKFLLNPRHKVLFQIGKGVVKTKAKFWRICNFKTETNKPSIGVDLGLAKS